MSNLTKEHILELLSNMKSVKEDINKLNQLKYSKTNDIDKDEIKVDIYRKQLEWERYFKQVKSSFYKVILVMRNAENKALRELKDEYNISYWERSINTNYIDITFSPKKDLLSARCTYNDRCGDYHYGKIKVPYNYFNMNENELIEAHTKWSINRIKNKYQKQERKEKLNKIEKNGKD